MTMWRIYVSALHEPILVHCLRGSGDCARGCWASHVPLSGANMICRGMKTKQTNGPDIQASKGSFASKSNTRDYRDLYHDGLLSYSVFDSLTVACGSSRTSHTHWTGLVAFAPCLTLCTQSARVLCVGRVDRANRAIADVP